MKKNGQFLNVRVEYGFGAVCLVPRNFSFNSSLIRVVKYFRLGMCDFLRLM